MGLDFYWNPGNAINIEFAHKKSKKKHGKKSKRYDSPEINMQINKNENETRKLCVSNG